MSDVRDRRLRGAGLACWRWCCSMVWRASSARSYDPLESRVLNGHGVETRKLPPGGSGLRALLEQERCTAGAGIAATRWRRTAPTDRNAHPHTDCTGTSRYRAQRHRENADVPARPLSSGRASLETETDTETPAHLIEDASGATLAERVVAAPQGVRAPHGLAVISESEPGPSAARRGAPLLIGVGTASTSWPRMPARSSPTPVPWCIWPKATSRSSPPKATRSSITKPACRTGRWTPSNGTWKASSSAATPTSCSRKSTSNRNPWRTRCAGECSRGMAPHVSTV